MQNFHAIFLTAVVVCAQSMHGAAGDHSFVLASSGAASSSVAASPISNYGIYGTLNPRNEHDRNVLESIRWIEEQVLQPGSNVKNLAFDSIHYDESGKMSMSVAQALFKERPVYMPDILANRMGFCGGRFLFTTLFGGLLPLSAGLALNADIKKIAGCLAFFGCLAIARGVYLRQMSIGKDALLPVYIDAAKDQQRLLDSLELSCIVEHPMDSQSCEPMKNITASDRSKIAGVVEHNTAMRLHVNTLLNSGAIDENGHWVMRELDAHIANQQERVPFLWTYARGWRDLEAEARAKLVDKQRFDAAGWVCGGLVPLALAGIIAKWGTIPTLIPAPN